MQLPSVFHRRTRRGRRVDDEGASAEEAEDVDKEFVRETIDEPQFTTESTDEKNKISKETYGEISLLNNNPQGRKTRRL